MPQSLRHFLSIMSVAALVACGAGSATSPTSIPNPVPTPASVPSPSATARYGPLVTMVSMIAPSPDWFVGVHDLSLLEGGDWVAEKVVELFPYDAGTDDGATYTSPDRDAWGTIRLLQEARVTRDGSVAPFGTFAFRRVQ